MALDGGYRYYFLLRLIGVGIWYSEREMDDIKATDGVNKARQERSTGFSSSIRFHSVNWSVML